MHDEICGRITDHLERGYADHLALLAALRRSTGAGDEQLLTAALSVLRDLSSETVDLDSQVQSLDWQLDAAEEEIEKLHEIIEQVKARLSKQEEKSTCHG